MKAMIFAAGLGTRLKPITDSIPKALLPVANKTLLEWQIEKLKKAGIRNIVVNVHHFPNKIITYINENQGFGCHIQISDERDQLLETGGGLWKAKDLLMDGSNEPILVCNVDILSNIDIRLLRAAYTPVMMGLLVVSERQTQRYLLLDKERRLKGWRNIATGEIRPLSIAPIADSLQPLAFSGMQILSPHIFEKMYDTVQARGSRFSLIDLYIDLCRVQPIYGYIPTQYKMMDVGKIDQLSEAELFARTLAEENGTPIS